MNDPMTNEQIAEIAEGLTKAQLKMLVEIGSGQPREFTLGNSGFALLRLKLAFVNELGARHLTDTGLAVRDYLERNGK